MNSLPVLFIIQHLVELIGRDWNIILRELNNWRLFGIELAEQEKPEVLIP